MLANNYSETITFDRLNIQESNKSIPRGYVCFPIPFVLSFEHFNFPSNVHRSTLCTRRFFCDEAPVARRKFFEQTLDTIFSIQFSQLNFTQLSCVYILNGTRFEVLQWRLTGRNLRRSPRRIVKRGYRVRAREYDRDIKIHVATGSPLHTGIYIYRVRSNIPIDIGSSIIIWKYLGPYVSAATPKRNGGVIRRAPA